MPDFYKAIANHVEGVGLVINSVLNILWDVLHKGFIIRRISLFAAWYLTFESYRWCFEAGVNADWDPLVIGASIGILTPVSGLLGATIKFYSDAKRIHDGT